MEPIHAIHLDIDNRRIKFAGYPVQERYCQTTTAQWGKNLCKSEYVVTDVSYPIIANVYSGSEFNSRRMLASYSYENFIEARARAKESNTPFTSKLVGGFERYGDDDRGFWVARENAWKNEAGEPFTLYCYKTTPAGFLLCSTTYQLKAGPHLTYQFHAPENDLEIVARRVDKNMRAMLDELSQP